MVTILLDSSNTNLSVGIAKDNILLDYISYEAWQRQSEYMIVELNKLLEKHNIKKKTSPMSWSLKDQAHIQA